MRLAQLPVLLLILIFSLPALLNSIGTGKVQIDMTNFGKAWEEYTAQPDSEKALKIYAMLPGSKDEEIRLAAEIRPLINKSLNVLESRIFSGERTALQIAFRLLVIADSTLETELAKILGNCIRFNARNFLQELKNHRDLVIDLSVIVCSFRLTQDGDTGGQELEKKSRQRALEYIEDSDLKSIKKECLKTLKKCKIK
ncbi:MAG: hypothetical protein KAW12_18925 [Candidatus Aminicenantes bacterium]|nr:hypothetical protein [Candidatus Aminicenantes bacterium]